MYRKFLTARSPLRVLEKGLHGGLGKGHVGVVLAGPGVGKTAFLVGAALDDLLRGDRVLHIVIDQTVQHTRAYYDTVFAELAATTHLEDGAVVHAEVDQLRTIRAYAGASFSAAKLRQAIQVAEQTGGKPAMVIVEGLEVARATQSEVDALRAIAAEVPAELWLSVACARERRLDLPPELAGVRDRFAVILALEPESGAVALRALKDHDNPDVEALRVALDPKSLLLKRS